MFQKEVNYERKEYSFFVPLSEVKKLIYIIIKTQKAVVWKGTYLKIDYQEFYHLLNALYEQEVLTADETSKLFCYLTA